MHFQFKQLSLPALILGCGMLILVGCDRRPEAYDGLRSEIIADLAEALKEGDSATTERSLDRLESLTEQRGFLAEVRLKEQRRTLINGLNEALVDADFDSAAQVVDENRPLITKRAELLDLPRILDSLRALDEYLGNRPYENYTTMSAALANVQGRARALASSPAFTQWLKHEQDALEQLRQVERRAQLSKLLDVCDAAAISRPIDVQIVFARLRDFAGDANVSQLYAELRDGKTGKLNQLFTGGEPPEDVLDRKGIEICLMACRDQLPPSLLQSYSEKLTRVEPESLSGYLLRIESAARMQRYGQALLWTRKYLDAGGQVEAELTDRLAARILLPPEHFNARVWRVPYPSVGDIIGRIVHWHAFHAAQGSEK